ncbi:uncharacterized protein LOC142229694 [Haematobia irritans]|uniref:uncharacterized protein LOC142229694 n=1 Tax=Haematobia irritans TaxID=7368 RepID=UPI003F4F5A46
METILAEVEAVLNSRPIAPLSLDPNDGEALTPALKGEGLRSLPPESAGDDSCNKVTCLRRWGMLCDLKQKFWKSWSKDYVLELQHKVKWNKEEANIQEGQIVVVHEDNLPPREWLTGVVINVVKGQDGKVRVAEIKTKNGIYKRPITKLAPPPNL